MTSVMTYGSPSGKVSPMFIEEVRLVQKEELKANYAPTSQISAVTFSPLISLSAQCRQPLWL